MYDFKLEERTPHDLNKLTARSLLTVSFLYLMGCSGQFSRSQSNEDLSSLEVRAIDAWLVDVNPSRPLSENQGTIPAYVEGKAGRKNQVIAQVETVEDDVIGVPLFEPSSIIEGNAVIWGKTRAPDYLFSSPVLSTNYKTMQRVLDIESPNQWVYKHSLSRQSSASYVDEFPIPDSIRSEVGATGLDRLEPWGSEEIVVAAVQLTESWKSITNNSNEWAVHFQWHDADGGLTQNPPASLQWKGGGSNPSQSAWTVLLRSYAYTPAEWQIDPFASANNIISTAKIENPQANIWHYFVAHYVTGCGPYNDPQYGFIYGPRDPSKVFFRFYHAVGDAPLVKVMDYRGFWGSPHPPTSDKKFYSGYWKTGIYTHTEWTSGTDVREAYTKGFMQWRLKDVPGLTPASALKVFKSTR